MEQARIAVDHFKEDFIYKIRSAIKEAYIRRDELNRIIRRLNFGKDRYQFKITKNKGLDGEYYDMFMDESLEIDPSTLSGSVEHQINMFSMDHEDKYGTLMNDLIRIFHPSGYGKRPGAGRSQKEIWRNTRITAPIYLSKWNRSGRRGKAGNRLKQNDKEKFPAARVRTPFMLPCSPALPRPITSICHPAVPQADHPPGGAGRSLFQDGCGKSGQLY